MYRAFSLAINVKGSCKCIVKGTSVTLPSYNKHIKSKILGESAVKINNEGIALIKQFEGCSLKAYKLEGEQYYTIGYGHSFDNRITATTVWTQKQADENLINDLQKYCNNVDEIAVKKFKNLNSNQCNALMSYCYNRGPGGLRELVEHSNTIEELGHNMVVYWGKAMRYKDGLVRRRKSEASLFFKVV